MYTQAENIEGIRGWDENGRLPSDRNSGGKLQFAFRAGNNKAEGMDQALRSTRRRRANRVGSTGWNRKVRRGILRGCFIYQLAAPMQEVAWTLSSCAAGVAVVNIDAGFKAGYLAGMIAAGATVPSPAPTT